MLHQLKYALLTGEGWLPPVAAVPLWLLTDINPFNGQRNSKDGYYTYCHTISQKQIIFLQFLHLVKIHCPTATTDCTAEPLNRAIIGGRYSRAADETFHVSWEIVQHRVSVNEAQDGWMEPMKFHHLTHSRMGAPEYCTGIQFGGIYISLFWFYDNLALLVFNHYCLVCSWETTVSGWCSSAPQMSMSW